jgi:hypothetical protein
MDLGAEIVMKGDAYASPYNSRLQRTPWRCAPAAPLKRKSRYPAVEFGREPDSFQRGTVSVPLLLEPEVALAGNHGLSEQDLNRARKIVVDRLQEIIDAWNRHFPG